MKAKIPVEIELDLSPEQVIESLTEWIYSLLKKYEKEGSDSCTSEAVVKNNKIYWQYKPYGWELQWKEIKIPDKSIFNLCKAAVQLLQSYEEIEEI